MNTDAPSTPGPMPPSTCVSSWIAVCSSDVTVGGELDVDDTSSSSGTQLNQPTVHRLNWSFCKHDAKPAMGLNGDGSAVTTTTASAPDTFVVVRPKRDTTDGAMTMLSSTGRTTSADPQYRAAALVRDRSCALRVVLATATFAAPHVKDTDAPDALVVVTTSPAATHCRWTPLSGVPASTASNTSAMRMGAASPAVASAASGMKGASPGYCCDWPRRPPPPPPARSRRSAASASAPYTVPYASSVW